MILVDTSIWIDLLNTDLGDSVDEDDVLRFATCGPVIQEVLQGLREGPRRDGIAGGILALPRFADPVPLELYLEAAEIFRLGRKRGYTIRSSMDCLIAAIAIKNRVPVWHKDRDFEHISQYTALDVFEPARTRVLPAT